MGLIITAAVGCRKLEEILSIACKQPMVVFGSMDGKKLSEIKNETGRYPDNQTIPVYLYETG